MTGRAYNPSGWEPEMHEKFDTPPQEAIEEYIKDWQKKRAELVGKGKPTYDEIQKLRERGESRQIGHYAYEMMYDVYAGIEDELMEGAIDCHLHIYPDYVPRSVDVIELAINASKAKMKAVVCKDHFFTNVGQAWAAQQVVEDLVRRGELDYSCKVFGTHILAWSHHPDQIRLIRKYPNLGAVYFYTFTGDAQFAGPNLKITDDNGELMPEVAECIELCGKYKIPIMTGHKPYELVLPIVKKCHEVGAHVLVTHAGGSTFGWSMGGTVEQAKELAKMGALLEVNGNKWLPSIIWPLVNPNAPLEYIKAVGAENCICDTDFGQVMMQEPVDGFKLFVRGMVHWGISTEDIKTMIQTNPAKFLYLSE